ncbi:MAG: carbon storage regulator [Planctomycetia bacterium]|nr:carbon storage regulator [Planctomycetia bacterium]
MLVLTRKNRESVVIGRPEDLQVLLEITILEIEGGRVRLGFEADNKMPIHRREVWDRICNGDGHAAGRSAPATRPVTTVDAESLPRSRPG